MDSSAGGSKERPKRKCSQGDSKKPLTDQELEDIWEDSEEDPFLCSRSEYEASASETDDSSSDIEDMVLEEEVMDAATNTLEPEDGMQTDPGTWYEVDCSHIHYEIFFSGTESYGYDPNAYPINKDDLTPLDVYRKLIDDSILELIVVETNRYVQQVKSNNIIKRSSRLNAWKDTNTEEILKFFGVILYMGLVKYPKIADYWSGSPLYSNSLVPKIMSRNRFQLLLKCVHFADNAAVEPNDRLHKIKDLFEMVQNNFIQQCNPGEFLAVDESMIPFRGRLLFRQYIPSKRHKYGIKFFKLCNTSGYTLGIQIYTGQMLTPGRGLAEKMVLDLTERYLDEGRTIVTDNYYTSVKLAKTLLERNTHHLGTLRKNRKGIPRDIVNCKLAK